MSHFPDYANARLKAVNGTGKQFHDDLIDCLATTLRVQAGHELQRNKVKELNQ